MTDETIGNLCRLYVRHPDSPFRDAKYNTQRDYRGSIKLIAAALGERPVPDVTVIDIVHCYREWRAPIHPDRPVRTRRAHGAVTVLRQVLGFGMTIRYPGCAQLVLELPKRRFARAGAREMQLTYPQLNAFIETAFQLEGCGRLEPGRGRTMAIGAAAQFDLTARQKDIIGEWLPCAEPDLFDPQDATSCRETWAGSFRWDNIPGWIWRLRTSKNRSTIEYDLSRYSILFPLLNSVPRSQRTGAIIKGTRGLPVRERTYRDWFRKIACTAGLPDSVWLMDARAGGATEADAAGADIKSIADHMTHAETRTTIRYVRDVAGRVAEVADARARKRAEGANVA
jgi:hypothetical protein